MSCLDVTCRDVALVALWRVMRVLYERRGCCMGTLADMVFSFTFLSRYSVRR